MALPPVDSSSQSSLPPISEKTEEVSPIIGQLGAENVKKGAEGFSVTGSIQRLANLILSGLKWLASPISWAYHSLKPLFGGTQDTPEGKVNQVAVSGLSDHLTDPLSDHLTWKGLQEKFLKTASRLPKSNQRAKIDLMPNTEQFLVGWKDIQTQSQEQAKNEVRTLLTREESRTISTLSDPSSPTTLKVPGELIMELNRSYLLLNAHPLTQPGSEEKQIFYGLKEIQDQIGEQAMTNIGKFLHQSTMIGGLQAELLQKCIRLASDKEEPDMDKLRELVIKSALSLLSSIQVHGDHVTVRTSSTIRYLDNREETKWMKDEQKVVGYGLVTREITFPKNLLQQDWTNKSEELQAQSNLIEVKDSYSHSPAPVELAKEMLRLHTPQNTL